MYRFGLTRHVACFAIMIGLCSGILGQQAEASDGDQVTVAILLGANSIEEPIGVVFGSPFETSHFLGIASLSYFGDYASSLLIPSTGGVVTQGGMNGGVWTIGEPYPPEHGWLSLDVHSDAQFEFADFVSISGDTIYPSSPSSASHLLLIVTGTVRGR